VKAHTKKMDNLSNLNRQADIEANRAIDNGDPPLLKTRWHNTDYTYVTNHKGDLVETNLRKLILKAGRRRESSIFKNERTSYFINRHKYTKDSVFLNTNLKDHNRIRPFVVKSRTGKLPTNYILKQKEEPWSKAKCTCRHTFETQVHVMEYCKTHRTLIELKYKRIALALSRYLRTSLKSMSNYVNNLRKNSIFRRTTAHSFVSPEIGNLIHMRIRKSKGRKNAINEIVTIIAESNKEIWESRLSKTPQGQNHIKDPWYG
jgi:hypothetical protein